MGNSMSKNVPRVRMFAGPNGSGKSTIKSVIARELLRVYINPDEIEDELKKRDFIDLAYYGIQTTADEVLGFFKESPLLEKVDLLADAATMPLLTAFTNKKAIKKRRGNEQEIMVYLYFPIRYLDHIK